MTDGQMVADCGVKAGVNNLSKKKKRSIINQHQRLTCLDFAHLLSNLV